MLESVLLLLLQTGQLELVPDVLLVRQEVLLDLVQSLILDLFGCYCLFKLSDGQLFVELQLCQCSLLLICNAIDLRLPDLVIECKVVLGYLLPELLSFSFSLFSFLSQLL